ncbi:MAG: acetolactate synthase large subunit [Burkholderiaceae bacterium]
MNAAQLLVKCLENEGVDTVFGLPGEENIDVMDALLGSSIRFVLTRHEQGAAFMADVYGRLTGRAGVCLSTLGPGATNLITGVADANMDRAPLVAIAGQGSTTRKHKESHQILDLVSLFHPITKFAGEIREPEIVPEIVRKAFKLAQTEKPGACFLELPENVAAMVVDKTPVPVQVAPRSVSQDEKIDEAARVIGAARCPVILAGNGVVRQDDSQALQRFAESLNIAVANTFMAKGVLAFSHPLSLGTIGLKSPDLPWFAFERADVVICIGYDMVEYPPELWNPAGDKLIVHIDALPAEVDEHYIVETGVLGDIGEALERLSQRIAARPDMMFATLREAIVAERCEHAQDDAFPLKPQKILWDLRQALAPEDIVVCDVGAHKMWTARLYQAERPNTCIISNGFASMGIAVPGAIAAKLVHPQRKVVALTGDAGFMMNSQEIETALRMKTSIVVLIWTDAEYGLIAWHQMRHFGRPSHTAFNNPDFVKYAQSFGAKGYRVESAAALLPTLRQALADDTVSIIDCPVDYAENMRLTRRLETLNSPM